MLAAALRGELPPIRVERILPTAEQVLEGGARRRPETSRIWSISGPPLLLKRYADAAQYRTEVGNLRFFNAVARAHTPRLLACDAAAHALLIEDSDGPTVAAMEALGGLVAQRTWERVLAAIAAVHLRAGRQMALLRRLYAPHWPAIAAVPAVDVLEAAMDAWLTSRRQPPLTVSERGMLIAAGSWLQERLNVAYMHYRMPIAGVVSVHGIVVNADRIIFTEMTQAVLGLQPADLLCTWQCADRRALIEQCYLAECARLGAPPVAELFWELDSVLTVAACAARLRRLARLEPTAFEDLAGMTAATCALLARTAQQLEALQGAAALIERLTGS
jgi:hypothetical protein